jgi:hypothetical protein
MRRFVVSSPSHSRLFYVSLLTAANSSSVPQQNVLYFKSEDERFEFLTAVLKKTQFLWDVEPRVWVDSSLRLQRRITGPRRVTLCLFTKVKILHVRQRLPNETALTSQKIWIFMSLILPVVKWKTVSTNIWNAIWLRETREKGVTVLPLTYVVTLYWPTDSVVNICTKISWG